MAGTDDHANGIESTADHNSICWINRIELQSLSETRQCIAACRLESHFSNWRRIYVRWLESKDGGIAQDVGRFETAQRLSILI